MLIFGHMPKHATFRTFFLKRAVLHCYPRCNVLNDYFMWDFVQNFFKEIFSVLEIQVEKWYFRPLKFLKRIASVFYFSTFFLCYIISNCDIYKYSECTNHTLSLTPSSAISSSIIAFISKPYLNAQVTW